ncbi:MAG: 2-acylglycerophosphoethanolamine acyltransferase, partial [Alphaproteobacteria bacterium]|nr:2-acylglycerophosphoethanolamine acyltransferase [Alphaproteobacteria bacterium]
MVNSVFDPAVAQISVFDALLRARAKAGGKTKIIEDHDRNPLSYDEIIRAAFALGGKIKAMTKPGENVGVLLPTGVGATVVFFALQAIGRRPAMLNFTAGLANLKGAVAAAGIKRILTADKFLDQANLGDLVAELATVADVVKLEAVRAKLSIFDK